jgi:hypothetical protein
MHRFASQNPYALLDELDALIAPGGAAGEWTSDLYVAWPDPPRVDDRVSRQVVVTCPDGRSVLIPIEYAALACPTDQRRQAAPPQAGDGEKEKEEVVERPTRKRPESAQPGGRRAEPGEAAPAPRPAETHPERPERTRVRPETDAQAEREARRARPEEPRTSPRAEPAPARPEPSPPPSEPASRSRVERPAVERPTVESPAAPARAEVEPS